MDLNATFYLLYSTEKLLNDEIDFILVSFFFFEFEKVNFQQVYALYISIINVIYYISYLPTDYINS